MNRWKGWWKQIRVLIRKDQVERELDEEVAFHLEMEADRLVREGRSRAEARREARLAFGGVERTKEEVRERRWVHGVEVPLADVRYALRTLRSRPGFATAAILTIALGVGGTTAVFSVVRGVLLRPLPYEEPGQLVRLYQYDAEAPGESLYVSAPHFKDYRELASSFESLATLYTYEELGADLMLDDRAQRVRLLPVSSDYFRVLRREPVRGRGFTRDEETGEPVAVVSEELWHQAGLDRAGLGAGLEVDGEVHTVVGVMPPGFEDPLVGRVDVWVPQNLHTAGAEYPGNHFLSVLGRLAPGVTPQQARQEMAALDRALLEKYPDQDDGGFQLVPLHEDLVAQARPALLLALGAVLLVLLVASVNLASLLLVRSLGRLREVSMRSALGAERGRILFQLLTESLVLGSIGGAVGVVLSHLGLHALLRLGRDAVPRASEVTIDHQVLAVAAALALGTAVAAGLAPALRLAGGSSLAALGDSTRTTTASRSHARLRQVLVAGQVGLALTLLVGASALAVSLYRLSRVELGFRAAEVLTFQLNLPAGHYDQERRTELHQRMLESLAALPGVETAGAVSVLPATGSAYDWGTRALTGPRAGTEEGFVNADNRVVAGRYFEALGIPLLEGRLLDERDGADAPAVAVVSRRLADRLFGETSAVGQTLRAGSAERRIVGVVGDVALGPEGDPGAIVYHAYPQFGGWNWALDYLLATASAPMDLLPAVRSTVAAVDPRLVVHRPSALSDVLQRGRSQRRFAFASTGAFAALALALSTIGLYGVLAFEVRQRRREIGVRLAMGAGPLRVVGMVLRTGLGLTLTGLLLGAAGALVLERLLSTLVFRTDPTEPLVLLTAAFTLLIAAAAATSLPAWRALRVPPSTALSDP